MNQLVVAATLAAVVLGCWLYSYAGYLKLGKPKGEKYDWGKLFDTLMKGGSSGAVLNLLVNVPTEIQVAGLFGAFTSGLILSAGFDKMSDVLS